MKILYYSPHPHLNLSDPAGYGTHMREMIAAFERQGCEVLPVIMGGKEPVDRSAVRQDGTQRKWKDRAKSIVGRKVWKSLKDLRLLAHDKKAAKHLEEKIKSFDPDIIYERANYLQMSGINSALKYDLPHILEVNAPFLEENKTLSGVKSYIDGIAQKYERLQAERTGYLVTVSEALKEYYVNKYELSPGRIIVTPNAVNPGSIAVDNEQTNRLKNKYDLKGNTVIGFVGSIFKWHGVDLLIEAFERLADRDSRLLVVGFGEYLEELKSNSEKLERKDDIIFTGKVPGSDVYDHIEVMDICVMANSNWYGSPVKIFEYGALAKPVIAPDVGPVREVMIDSEEGLLVKPAAGSLHEALEFMLSNPEKAQKMGKRFQEKIFNQYTWDRNAERALQHLVPQKIKKI